MPKPKTKTEPLRDGLPTATNTTSPSPFRHGRYSLLGYYGDSDPDRTQAATTAIQRGLARLD